MTLPISHDEVRRLAEGITPGPWATCQWQVKTVMPLLWANDEINPAKRGRFAVTYSSEEPDAAAIAALPDLLATADALYSEREVWVGVVERLRAGWLPKRLGDKDLWQLVNKRTWDADYAAMSPAEVELLASHPPEGGK